MKKMNKGFLTSLGLIGILACACTTLETESNQQASWADDLTPAQVFSVMPVSVDMEGGSASPQVTGISKMSAVPEEAIKITWRIPKHIFDVWGWTHPFEIYSQNEDGGWEVLPANITRSEVEDSITGAIDFVWMAIVSSSKCHFKGGMLATLKVSLPDHNTGVPVESIVTFMVAPDKDIRVSLVEASAVAPSSLYGQYSSVEGSLFSWNLVFKDMQNFVGGVDMPEVKILKDSLPAFSPVKFYIESDFSGTGWDFEEDVVVHESNTSFCKVTEVTQDVPADTMWRLKYSFEDLPLEKSAIEANGLFDYNDLVFYLDILK